MNQRKSWQLGPPGTLASRIYDHLRRKLNLDLVRYFTEMMDENSAWRFLEAGSGPAFASSLLAQVEGVDLSVALDIDLEALLEARHRDPSLPVIVADLEYLPFTSDSFDLVWNNSTLEHISNRQAALEEMSRVTLQGGNVFVGVPYRYGPLGIQKWVANTSLGIWIGELFDRIKLLALITDCGLLPKTCFYYFYGFFIGVLAEKINLPDISINSDR